MGVKLHHYAKFRPNRWNRSRAMVFGFSREWPPPSRIFEISNFYGRTSHGVEMHHCVKFRRNRSNRGQVMSVSILRELGMKMPIHAPFWFFWGAYFPRMMSLIVLTPRRTVFGLNDVIWAIQREYWSRGLSWDMTRQEKVTKGLYLTCLWGSPHWSDVHENLFSRWCSLRNHVCQVSKWNFQGLRFYRGSNFPFSYWFLNGPYNSAALLWCESAGKGCSCPHPPSPFYYYYSTWQLILIYHPTEGGRLSQPRHCSKGVWLYITVAVVLSAAAAAAWHDSGLWTHVLDRTVMTSPTLSGSQSSPVSLSLHAAFVTQTRVGFSCNRQLTASSADTK